MKPKPTKRIKQEKKLTQNQKQKVAQATYINYVTCPSFSTAFGFCNPSLHMQKRETTLAIRKTLQQSNTLIRASEMKLQLLTATMGDEPLRDIIVLPAFSVLISLSPFLYVCVYVCVLGFRRKNWQVVRIGPVFPIH